MISVLLSQIKTRDGITLDGIYVPPKRKSKTALVWIHGLSSRFSSGQTLIKELSDLCKKNGIGYFKFNNRGHDVVNRDGKDKKYLQGGGVEKFEECILDVSATISFARSLGYKKIILAGHSTGANKALYYVYQTQDRRVSGLMLLGPISDIAAMQKVIGRANLNKGLKTAKKILKENPQLFMPPGFGYLNTAKRFISLYTPGTAEDVFPHYDEKANWRELGAVKIPIAVIVGSRDEHLDIRAQDLVEIFRKNADNTKMFSGIIIKGANHGFHGREKELASSLVNLIKYYEL